MLYVSETAFASESATRRRLDEIDRLRSVLPADAFDEKAESFEDTNDAIDHLHFLEDFRDVLTLED